MAARRLLIIMVVLLAISTLAAALVPPPEENQESSSSTSTSTRTTQEPTKADDLVRSEVPVPERNQAPRQIEVAPGDQLELTVTSGEPGEVSVPDFGLVEFAGPGNPATFNVLIERKGQFPVRFQGSGTVATIVAERKRASAS